MTYTANTSNQPQQNDTDSKKNQRTTNDKHSNKEMTDSVKEGAQMFMDKAQEEAKHLYENSEKYLDEACDYVKKNPGKSVLAAIAGGFILGLLLKG